MATHILRDFAVNNNNSFYPSNSMLFAPYLYITSLFMNKVLGHSVVGQTGFDINNSNSQTFTNAAATVIAAGSDGQSLPQSTINVTSTTGFPASGTMYVTTSDGVQIVKYSGTTATTFTNCTGGTGTMTAGFTTTANSGQTLPVATINVTSTAGFPTSGTIYVVTTVGPQTVTYTGVTPTSFTGCSGGTGSTTGAAPIGSVASAGGGVACGPNRIVSAISSTRIITTNFPHGMSDGQFARISSGGTINVGVPFSPYPVEVVSSTELRLLTSAGWSAYTTNSQILYPPGMLIASGTGASINFAGGPSVYAVQVPAATRTVVNGTAPSAGDTGRLLVIKSNSYPTKNSGVFKITATNTATNSYTVDYRSSDAPPPESNLQWWLYEEEPTVAFYMPWIENSRNNAQTVSAATNTTPIQVTINVNTVSFFKTGQRVTISGATGNTAANGTWTITVVGPNNVFLLNGSSGNGTYAGGGSVTTEGYFSGSDTSYASRILLQSPHSTAWQTRLCVEAWNSSNGSNYSSITLGENGSVNGDFPIGGVTTLIPQFLDTNAIITTDLYRYTTTGTSYPYSASRITAVGDDTGRSVFVYTRTQASGANGLMMMGLPDNEPSSLPAHRFFAYGGATGSNLNYGGIQMRWGTSNNAGVTFGDINPELCAIAGLVNADGVSGTSTVYSSNAGDCPFTGTTEVLPWEVWAGIATDASLNLPYPATGNTVYSINQRFMGTAPFIRQGRTNFGTFTQSTENTSTLTVTGATNDSPIQITTSGANSLTTGQTVVISGVTGNTAANGTFVITVIDNTHFTLNGTTGNGAYGGGGIVNGTARWMHLQNGIYLAWNGAGGLTP